MKWIVLMLTGVVTLLYSCSNSKKTEPKKRPASTGEPVMEKELMPFCKHENAPFYHGVASGDPLPNAVILWTRITPDFHQPCEVEWQVSLTNTFVSIVKQGRVKTSQEKDYTVKIDVTELKPATYYYYRFKFKNKFSQVGRTKTAAADSVGHVKLAFASCSNYAWGYFNAYSLMAKDTLDAVVHLGDYIYEHEQNTYQQNNINRRHLPNKEIVSLKDYRMRYSQYRLDKDLQEVHAAHPFITVWDDHELANNAYDKGAQNHQPNEGDWSTRLTAAKKAYYEWMPVRENNDNLYRSFQYGNLLNLAMLDTRVEGREVQLNEKELLQDTSRKMIDNTQLNWLRNELDKPVKWRIIGNQVLMGTMKVYFSTKPELYTDGWDGYPYQQEKLLSYIAKKKNVVIVTGDFHSSFALRNIYKGKQVADEFVVPSITSANYDEDWGLDSAMVYRNWYLMGNPNLYYANLINHGYTTLNVTQGELKVNFIFVDNVLNNQYKTLEKISYNVQSK